MLAVRFQDGSEIYIKREPEAEVRQVIGVGEIELPDVEIQDRERVGSMLTKF